MKNRVFMLVSLLIMVACAVLPTIFSLGRLSSLCYIVAAFATLVPFFGDFERKTTSELIAISAVMTGISVAGRFLFAPIPFFKPVTAIVIITGISLGKQCGFMVGALSALISNIYFGQGPWTPFQMLAWGLIGYFAGVLASKLNSSKVLLYFYGGFSGIIYSLIMDCCDRLCVTYYRLLYSFKYSFSCIYL